MDKLLEFFESSAENLNQNKYFIGLTMISLNIGARFIIDELGDDLRKIVSNATIRRLFIFCSFFMATKDLFTALFLTIIFVILINEVFTFEEDNETQDKDTKKGASYNKDELDKTIQKLKNIQATM